MARVSYDVRVPMRDGVELSADIYLPDQESPCPAVFNMTPYGTPPGDGVLETTGRSYADTGMAYVAVDVRGRYDSGGDWYAHPPDEALDGSDVISWIAAQSWNDGRVVTTGHSYSGWNQWPIAMEHNAHHVAMASSGSPTSLFVDWPNLDGVLSLQPIATWALGMMYGRGGESDDAAPSMSWGEALRHLPLSELDTIMAGRRLKFWQDWLSHDRLDDFWTPLNMNGRHGRVRLPTFHASGWYDARLKGQVAAYEGVLETASAPEDHLLVIGPWLHSPLGKAPRFKMRDFGEQADVDMAEVRRRWIAATLGLDGETKLSGAIYFVQVANVWRHAPVWPVPGTRFVPYHLDSAGSANTRHGDGRLQAAPGTGQPDEFVSDPADPVPTNWSPTRAEGIIPSEPHDNREVEERADVLVYSSEPLETPLEVTGPIRAVIYFSTDAPDTDIAVKLLDVAEDGTAYQLSYGLVRARYRDGFEMPTLMEAGKVYCITVELQPTSTVFLPGHRVRIEVSGSNFPFYARNLNTGENSNTSARMQIANIAIHHSALYPSHIVLPIVDDASVKQFDFGDEAARGEDDH